MKISIAGTGYVGHSNSINASNYKNNNFYIMPNVIVHLIKIEDDDFGMSLYIHLTNA